MMNFQMKTLSILLSTVLATTAFAQELSQDAPLEFVKPSTTPLDLREPQLPPEADPVFAPASEAQPNPAPAPTPTKIPRNRRVRTVKIKMPPVLVKDTLGKAERGVASNTYIKSSPGATSNTNSLNQPPPLEMIKPTEAPVQTPAQAQTPPPPAVVIENKVEVQTAPQAPVAPVVAAPTQAAAERRHHSAPPGSGRKKALSNARVTNIWAVKGSTKTGSFMASWNPVLYPYQRWNFGLAVGATIFESEAVSGKPSDTFWVYEYGASVSYYVSRRFLPEVIIGAQTWNDADITNHFMLAANANFLFRERPYRVLDRVVIGYGMLNMDTGNTHIFRAGLGFRF